MLVGIGVRTKRRLVGGEGQEGLERVAVADRVHPRHAARFGIDDGLMSKAAVVGQGEEVEAIAEIAAERRLRPEHQSARVRMQAVGADDDVEPALRAALEADVHSGATACVTCLAQTFVQEMEKVIGG